MKYLGTMPGHGHSAYVSQRRSSPSREALVLLKGDTV